MQERRRLGDPVGRNHPRQPATCTHRCGFWCAAWRLRRARKGRGRGVFAYSPSTGTRHPTRGTSAIPTASRIYRALSLHTGNNNDAPMAAETIAIATAAACLPARALVCLVTFPCSVCECERERVRVRWNVSFRPHPALHGRRHQRPAHVGTLAGGRTQCTQGG